MTKVVHCKKEPYDLYIGRKNGELPESIWANPFKLSKFERTDCVHKYEYWLNTQPDLLEQIPTLKGKTLACWCAPEFCHGDVLVKMAESKYIINWFSNMRKLEVPYKYQNIVYDTSENFYQAMKLPKDRVDLRAKIAAMSPYAAKKSIRDKEKFKWRSDWDKELSIKVMEHILTYKFLTIKGFENKSLHMTEDWEITEWNNWGDTFWGKDIKTRKGENNLGKILMRIRDKCVKH